MATSLTKTVRRVVTVPPVGPLPAMTLVLELRPNGLTLREKGRRTTYGPVPYRKLLLQAATHAALTDLHEEDSRP